MKLIILRNNLKNALSVVEKAIIENGNLPILKNILLFAEKKLIISATNLEIGISHITAAKISEPGKITIPFSALNTVITNTTNERITLQTEGETVVIKTDNYEAKIQSLPPDDFPIIPEIEDEEKKIEIKASELKNAFSLVVGAAGVSELKPELASVMMKYETGVIKLAATDGFRLAEKTLLNNVFSTNYLKGFQVLIPIKTAQEILRIFLDEEIISISVDDHQIVFSSPQTKFISRIIDGQYPDYEKIVPQQIFVDLLFDRKEFLAGIKLVSSFSGKTNDIRLKIGEGGKSIEMYAANQEVGENNYIIPAKKQKGETIPQIVFNWRYLLDGVKPFSSEMVRLGLVSEAKPAVFRPATDDSVYYIVMPIQE